jgi:hypothetical protein
MAGCDLRNRLDRLGKLEGKALAPVRWMPYLRPSQFFSIMGKQYNKVEKKRRRLAYLARKKAKAKAPGSKVKAVKKPAPKKKAEAAA